jgi:prophage maintenance system killer protein
MSAPVQIYQSEDGQTRVEVRVGEDTVWLRQEQMSELFGRERSVITKHLRNVFKEGELGEKSNVQNLHIAGSDRPVKFYNLDVIISVGYRVKSAQGTRFRHWATQVLRQHLVQGYTLNQARFERNAAELAQALALIRKAARSPAITAEAGSGLVEIVSRYTQTFLWLQRYDEGMLAEPDGQPGGRLPSTVEAMAAHLLYFVVKNHPFSDGNKRSGAFLFVDFLHRNGRLLNAAGEAVINDAGLAALTLLVAESDPKQMETLIRLIMNMLAQEAGDGEA